MNFQPFGYRFEIECPSAPSDVKMAIRARKTRWLDPKNGARGWIVGPVICLWFSAFDRYGPMLFGLISHDNLGTRVRGRAGSDLNGVVMFSLLIPLTAFLIFNAVSEGQASSRQLLIFAAIFLVGGPIIYWSAHKDRRAAEPLVRFIRDAVTVSGRALRSKSSAVTISKALTLVVGKKRLMGFTSEAIHDALLGAGAGDFVILESGPETYLQTLSRDGKYIIEMRDGDSLRFEAIHRGGASTTTSDSSVTFTFEEVREVFMAYASEAPMPHFLTWKRMRLA